MRIAFVSHPWDRGFPPSESIAIVSYGIARQLTAMPEPHDVVVYARGERRDEQHDGITYRYLPRIVALRAIELLQRAARRAARIQPFASPFFHLDYALQVARDLRSHPCDLIVVHNFSQFVPILRRVNPGARIAIYMHCDWLSALRPSQVASRLRTADLILGDSEWITSSIRQAFPRLADRCATLYYGVDTQLFSPVESRKDEATPRLVFVNRISPEKGVHILIEAFDRVVERYPDVELDIVGDEGVVPFEMLVGLSNDECIQDLRRFYDGSYLEATKSLLTDRTASRVVFSGWLDRQGVADHYRAADVFVSASLYEAFGMGVVEAMAAGLPVVATRVGGMVESVEEGVTGILVERNDPRALAEGILRLLEDGWLRRRMGAEARRRAVEGFSWERTAEELLRHYEEAPAGTPQAPASTGPVPSR